MAEVIDYVTGHPAGIGPTDLAEALDIDPKQAQVYLARAVQSGRLGKVKRGLYAPRATP
jgi:DNA-binding IclR family transcriptional regulator